MNISVRSSVDAGLVRELGRRASAARHTGDALTAAAIKLQGRARDHSSGRPGPNIITYQFWSAWTWAVGADGISATVANGSTYAARLEFGFVGVDSMGRHYNQPPYPSLGPAVMESEDLLGEELEKVLFR